MSALPPTGQKPEEPAAPQGGAYENYEAPPLETEADGFICEMAMQHGATLLNDDGSAYGFTQEQLLTFTKANRASRGQAPAQAAPACLTCNDHGAVGNILTAEPCPDCTRKAAPAAVAGPSGYGPKVTVKRRCSDCKACNSESYAVQGDSGHYVYCEHPSLPERKYIGDTHWDTPDWCPAAAPTIQPAPQPSPASQGDALDAAKHCLEMGESFRALRRVVNLLLEARRNLGPEDHELRDRIDRLLRDDAARAAQEGK